LDAVLGIPQEACPERFKEVWQVFVQFLLECAKQGSRIKTKGQALELAKGQWRSQPVHLVLSSQRELSFGAGEVLAVIRGETNYPEWDVVEGLHVRRFQGLACFLQSAAVKELTAECAEFRGEEGTMTISDVPAVSTG
jgi:hypothetical protein